MFASQAVTSRPQHAGAARPSASHAAWPRRPASPAAEPGAGADHHFGRVRVFAGTAAQRPALTVAPPDGAGEREAERMAGAALGGGASVHAAASPAGHPELPVPGPVSREIERLRGSGASLDTPVRAEMEARFGRSLDGVRVHTGSRAAAAAAAVQARAFTVGRDIVFGAGQYAPGRPEGRRLLAHELAHTLQGGAAGRLHRAIDITRTPPPGFELTFPFMLRATGLTVPCTSIYWEQFISGGITYLLSDGSTQFSSACDWGSGKGKRAFGPWCDDLTGSQTPGPRPRSASEFAKCGGEPNAVVYEWTDAPGTFKKIGDTIDGKTIEEATFDIGIDHKLWDWRYRNVFLEKVFYLRGKRGRGMDTTHIDL